MSALAAILDYISRQLFTDQRGTVFVEYTSLVLLITLFALTVLSQFGGGPAPN
jgi:Flp pilus assembly pilin Flp